MDEAISRLMEKFKGYKADGKLSLGDIFKFLCDAVTELVYVVEGFKDKTGTEKKSLVISALETLYSISGLNIPWVPDFLERRILFRYILPAIIVSIVGLLNKTNVFKHEQEIKLADTPGLTTGNMVA